MWLIHIDTWNYADPQKIIDLVPKDIRPYVVMNISLSINHDEATSRFRIAEYGYEIAKSWLRTCAENQMWAVVQQSSGGFAHFSDFDLSVYEEFYRDYPNLIGYNYCEQFWGYDSQTDLLSPVWSDRINHFADLLELSDQYGGYLVVSWCGNQWSPNINPIGMLKRNPDFAAACRGYTENYILCEKYTQQSYQSDMESLCLGAYLSGYSGQYGIRYDDTGWTDASGNHSNFTMATYGAPFLEHVMLTGQTVIDAPELIWTQCFREINAGSAGDGYSTRRWETFPQFDNVSVDLFRKVLDGTVRIPSRQEVIDRTKVAIINNRNSGSSDQIYSSPETLFQGLYRMDGDGNLRNNKTFFKKTGRYPTIPTVFQLDDAPANSFQVQVDRTDYSTRWPAIADKVTEFDNLFPEEYTGDLYAGRHENGWVTYNPFKTGQTASANIPFKYNTCDHLELTYSQYTAGVIKEYADYMTIYLSNYDNVLNAGLKTDIIKIYGSSSEPTFSFTDRANHQPSTVSSTWDNGVFTLTVSHNGPLDIKVNCSGTATDRLTEYQTAAMVVPHSPDVYNGPRQYEAETFDYKSISGIIKNGYDRNIRNYTGQGYLNFGVNAAARVRDFVIVLNDGTYILETRYTSTGGDINTIDLYVNGTKVATPLFTQTSSLGSWAVNIQNVELNMGTNTIEFRATARGASTIYFDNMVIRTGNADDVWLEAECGIVGSLWDAALDPAASNGVYTTIQLGNNSTGSAPEAPIGHITYDFRAGESGTYKVWGRVLTPTTDDNAFWVKMDDNSWAAWSEITPSTSWTWVKIDSFVLDKGDHTFTVAYNKDGAQLDKLFLTRSDDIPSGKGGPANNCSTTNQSPIAYAGSDRTVIDIDADGREFVELSSAGSVDPDGRITAFVWTKGDSQIATGSNPSVELAVGEHTITLTVTDNDGATDTDDVRITVQEGSSADADIWLEAECATVGAEWDILSDTRASNGHYLTAKAGFENKDSAPVNDDGVVNFPVSVKYGGNYSLFARLNCPTYDDDSFWVKMDNRPFQMHNGLVTSGWEWIKFGDYELTEGNHTLAIGYREDGARLDKVCLSLYLTEIEGFGEEAENLCNPSSVTRSAKVPNYFALEQNYPNPFNPSTRIDYRLPTDVFVTLKVFDVLGKQVETLVNEQQNAGQYSVQFDASHLPSGVYFYRIEAGAYHDIKKLLLFK